MKINMLKKYSVAHFRAMVMENKMEVTYQDR